MKQPGVYLITNTLDGKVYVGSSAHVPRRLYVHRRNLRKGVHDSAHLQRAWDRDGEAAFTFMAHEAVDVAAELLAREQHWIDTLRASDQGHGYNAAPVAGTRAGCKQPDGFSELIAAVHRGKPKSAETRARMSAAAKGRAKSPEHRAKLAEAARQQMADPAARAHLSALNTGKRQSAETRQLKSEIFKGRPIPPHVRDASAESNRQRVWTDEMRAKASASKRAAHATRVAVSCHGPNTTARGFFDHNER